MMRRDTILAKPGTLHPKWRVVDAAGVPLGRLAAEVATALMGKDKPEWTPHVLSGDCVVVTNARRVALTGRKAEQRLKMRYSGYPGGLKAQTYGQVREQKPERLVNDAVRRMLPKSRLGRVMLANLKVFPEGDHPYADKKPAPMTI